MTIKISLTEEEKRIILSEVRDAFVQSNFNVLDKKKYSYKITQYVTSEYMEFYKEFINAIFDVTMYMYENHLVSSMEEIHAVMNNVRYHNLEEWELKAYFKWVDGDDIFEYAKAGFFDDNFLLEDVEEVIEYVLGESSQANI